MVFPNATLHIAREEAGYWLSPGQRARASEPNRKYFDEAVARVQPYVDTGKVTTFDGQPNSSPACVDAMAGRYWIAGDHVAFPGIGHVQTGHQGYRWITAPFVNDYYEANKLQQLRKRRCT